MKLASAFGLAGLLLLCPSPARAQAVRPSGPVAGHSVLNTIEGRRELKLSEAQIERLSPILEEIRARTLDELRTLNDLPPDQYKTKGVAIMEARGEEGTRRIAEILDGEQFACYQQVRIQAWGIFVFRSDGLAERLQLSDDQRRDLEQRVESYDAESLKLYRDFENDRPKLKAVVNALHDREIEAIVASLSESQREAWYQMIGDPFPMGSLTFVPRAANPQR